MIPNLTTNRRGRLLLVVQEAVYVGTRRWACQRVEPLSTAKAWPSSTTHRNSGPNQGCRCLYLWRDGRAAYQDLLATWPV